MYISGAKFEEHCFLEILLIQCFTFWWNDHEVTTFLIYTIQKHNYNVSLKLKVMFQNEKRHSSLFWKATNIFYYQFLEC